MNRSKKRVAWREIHCTVMQPITRGMAHQKETGSVPGNWYCIFWVFSFNNLNYSQEIWTKTGKAQNTRRIHCRLTVKCGFGDALCIFCISLYSLSSRRARMVLSMGGCGTFIGATVDPCLLAVLAPGDTPLEDIESQKKSNYNQRRLTQINQLFYVENVVLFRVLS